MTAKVASNSYVILWTQRYCRMLRDSSDHGPFAVIFGGPHTSLPSIAHLRPGDWIYPVSLYQGRLSLIARMRIVSVLPIDEYNHINRFPRRGQRHQEGCIHHAATGELGTLFSFDHEIPLDVVAALRFGSKAGSEIPLKHLENGLLMHPISLQGHYRRLSEASAGLLEALIHRRDNQRSPILTSGLYETDWKST